jgi:hypothetical protein
MGVGNYSVPLDIIKHLSVRSIDAFRPLSTRWHCFLGLARKHEAQQAWKSGIGLSTRNSKQKHSSSSSSSSNYNQEAGRELIA